MTPVISVIVVTYNQESTVGRTLDSILAQRIDVNYEIVIGDDCSTDGTETICRRYAELHPDRIIYLRRERNIGVVANYFDCISRSRGRYLADCAGDDYWVDDAKLRRQYEVMESRPDVTMVSTRWLDFDERDGSLSVPRGAVTPGEYDGQSLMVPILCNGATLHLCTSLYRRDVIDCQLRENPDILTDRAYTTEDQPIMLAMASRGRVVVLPDITLHYSVGHPSVSRREGFYNRYLYSTRALSEVLKLTGHFVPTPSASERRMLNGFHRRVTDYIAAQAFRSGPDRLKNTAEFKRLMKGLNHGWKYYIYRALMANVKVWSIASRVRDIIN